MNRKEKFKLVSLLHIFNWFVTKVICKKKRNTMKIYVECKCVRPEPATPPRREGSGRDCWGALVRSYCPTVDRLEPELRAGKTLSPRPWAGVPHLIWGLGVTWSLWQCRWDKGFLDTGATPVLSDRRSVVFWGTYVSQ